jgi:glycosyltransferase EpsH
VGEVNKCEGVLLIVPTDQTFMIVTLVVPIYNSALRLENLFSSLQRQSFRSFACIFVYDKSNDGTLTVLYSLISKWPDLSCFVLEKSFKEGVGKARDFALDSGMINSKYILFLDSDDSFESTFLEELVFIAEKTNSDIAMCGFDRTDEVTGQVLSTEMVHNPDLLTDLSKSPIVPYLNPAPWNKLYRMDKIRDARFVYPGGGEDEMFFLKVLPNCQKIAFVNKVLYHYQIHKGSVLSGTNVNLYEKAKEGYKSVIDFYKNHGKNYSAFLSLCEACIFIRFGIGMTTRTCLAVPREKKRLIKESKAFFNQNLLGWRHNKLLSFCTSLKHGIKSLLIWRCRLLYKVNFFSLFVFDYKIFTRLFRKDIKW